MMELYGSIRIKNPKTLERWIKSGEYDELIKDGFTFYSGCGRFRLDVCTCYKCRQKSGTLNKLDYLIKDHENK